MSISVGHCVQSRCRCLYLVKFVHMINTQRMSHTLVSLRWNEVYIAWSVVDALSTYLSNSADFEVLENAFIINANMGLSL